MADQIQTPRPRLAFVHVPKCGGTSVQYRLAEYYGEDACLRVGDPEFGADIQMTETEEIWKEALARSRVIYGHYFWPALRSIIEKTGSRPFTPIGLVREPLERAISEYWFIREYPRHPKSQLCNDVPISEYLLEHHDHNCQCLYTAGTFLFPTALERIQKEFEAICPLDEIDEFSRLLAVALQKTHEPVPHLNKSATAEKNRRVGPKTASRFYEKNVADLRLYWWVTEQWRNHWRFLGSIADLERASNL